MGAGGGLGTMMDQRVDCSIKDPSKLQKLGSKKIPDFLSEYVKKYGKDDNDKVYALWFAYSFFCYIAAKNLHQQVESI